VDLVGVKSGVGFLSFQVTLWEALNKAKPVAYSTGQEDQLLQQSVSVGLFIY